MHRDPVGLDYGDEPVQLLGDRFFGGRVGAIVELTLCLIDDLRLDV